MRHDPYILETIFRAASEWVHTAELPNAEQYNLLVILCDWLGSSHLVSVLSGDIVDRLSEGVQQLSQEDTVQASQPARSLAVQMSARLEVIKSVTP